MRKTALTASNHGYYSHASLSKEQQTTKQKLNQTLFGNKGILQQHQKPDQLVRMGIVEEGGPAQQIIVNKLKEPQQIKNTHYYLEQVIAYLLMLRTHG